MILLAWVFHSTIQQSNHRLEAQIRWDKSERHWNERSHWWVLSRTRSYTLVWGKTYSVTDTMSNSKWSHFGVLCSWRLARRWTWPKVRSITRNWRSKRWNEGKISFVGKGWQISKIRMVEAGLGLRSFSRRLFPTRCFSWRNATFAFDVSFYRWHGSGFTICCSGSFSLPGRMTRLRIRIIGFWWVFFFSCFSSETSSCLA